MPPDARVPLATYRVQWQVDFGFKDALGLVPYLEALGISDLYVPPITKAQAGAIHGYAVVDPTVVSPALGTEEDVVRLGRALADRGMGLLVDLVPNHMGIAGAENRYFVDVLEHGRCSTYADLFDIEWDPPKEALKDKLLLPILGEQYGDALNSGRLRLVHADGVPQLAYGDLRLPLEPTSIVPVLEDAAAQLDTTTDEYGELMSIAASFRHLPRHRCDDAAAREERKRESDIGHRRLRDLVARAPNALAAIDKAVNRAPIDAMLREQCYRPCYWRVSLEATNYRRFFDVNDLAAIRVESPPVFDMVHELVVRLVREGAVHGVRVDHLDGLLHPHRYLRDLRGALGEAASAAGVRAPYVVVEKILERGEVLPESFACAGTTGYDFIRLATGILVDESAQGWLDSLYRRAAHDSRGFEELVYETKRLVVDYLLSSEVAMLTRSLERIADGDPRSHDFSRKSLESAIKATLASFPVYRTYIEPDGARDDRDAAYIERALAAATRRASSIDRSVFVFLRNVLFGKAEDETERAARLAFAMKFQQTTGPVMAKAVEDTAFYAAPVFLAVNEVGCDPTHAAVTVEELHEALAQRATRWPHTMNTTSTHDTKRSEDVRARLAVLSEMPDAWRSALSRWRRMGKSKRTRNGEDWSPSPVDELAWFQTLVGVAPFGVDTEGLRALAPRLVSYMIKFAREAKRSTSWIQPDEAYEAGLARYIEGMLADDAFVADALAFCHEVDPHGASNALAQCALKLMAPGIPDFYQGSELWHQRLVDPDNRIPVDFAEPRARLRRLRESTLSSDARARDCLTRYVDGDVKLLTLSAGLALRKSMPKLFRDGGYLPISGEPHAFAFARVSDRLEPVVTVVTRLPHSLLAEAGDEMKHEFAIGEAWRGRRLRVPRVLHGTYEDVLTGRNVKLEPWTSLEAVLTTLPIAMLKRT